ncbi:MAG: HD domain-containing protein [Desulfomonilia bacterium]|jgi:3'-5' exoribonuclease
MGMIPKGRYVTEYREGDPVRSVFLLSQRKLLTARNGKPYARLMLADKSGEIMGMVWDDAQDKVSELTPGDVVGVRGIVEAFDGRLQVKVEKVVRLSEAEVEISELIPAASGDIPSMMAELDQWVAGIGNRHLRALVEAVFSADGVRESFQKAPAAKGVHHSYLGGLLEHTLSILRLIEGILPSYAHLNLNRDLLVAGAVLHDIGKIYEYSFRRAIDMTAMGRLVGHIYLSASMADQAISRIPGFPAELRLQVLHLILGHHGQLEFGSPKLPMTREALLLHMLDDLDAKITGFSSIIEATPRDEEFSSYSPIYNRQIYTRTYEENDASGHPDGADGQ